MRRDNRVLILWVSLVFLGCTEGKVISQNSSPIVWNMNQKDELMAYAKIQIKTYEDEGYTEVTDGEIDSLVSDNKIRVWVSTAVAGDYLALSEGIKFPIGSTVIRVLYDEQNKPTKITASIKAAVNQNPDASDWVFAVADPSGIFMKDTLNNWQFGALEACNACHINQAATDGLFGLQR